MDSIKQMHNGQLLNARYSLGTVRCQGMLSMRWYHCTQEIFSLVIIIILLDYIYLEPTMCQALYTYLYFYLFIYFWLHHPACIILIPWLWQEYTEELYKKDLHDPDNHDGVITQLEPDILECEVKWAITTNKASGGDEIPVELFQPWKMMLWKCCTQYASKSGNSAVATGLEMVSFHSNPKERQCQRILKLPPSCTHLIC